MTDTPVHFRIKTVALAALCFHAFFAMTDFGGQLKPEYGAAVALLLMFVAGPAPWRELAKQPVAWTVAAFVLFLIVHAAYATSVYPRIGYSKQLSAAAELVRLGVFACVIGWWLSLMPRLVPVLLGLMVVGLLTAVAIRMPWMLLSEIWAGQIRPKFGMPENLGGQLAALSGWLALCLLLKLWNAHGRFHRRRGLMAICLLAYVGSLCVLLFSQSRGAWLAFAATLPVVVLGVWYTRKREAAVPWLPLVSVAGVSLLLVLGARGIVAKRVAGAEQLLPEMVEAREPATAETGAAKPAPPQVSGDSDTGFPAKPVDIPPGEANNKAVGQRMALYRFGIERWREHPLLGWGLRSTSALIAGSGLDLGGQRHGHLHSAYIDALVGMGVAGTAILALLLALLVRELVLARRSGVMSNATFWMVAGCIGIVLIANGFDSLMWRYDYSRAPLEIVFGCCVAYGLLRRRPPLHTG